MKETFPNGIEDAFDNLYTKGAFFTVGDEKKANTMTISWGSIGYMWRRPMFMAMIRESRYSNEFLGLGEIIEGCEKYYECKIVLKQEIDFSGMKEEIQNDFYPENETKHILYFGEIVAEY